MSFDALRSELVYYFEQKAAFRENVVERIKDRQPWDVAKNERYAQSIRKIVEYVQQLPDDDPDLKRLAACDCEQLFDGLSDADIHAIHCGPRGQIIESGDLAGWFSFWVDVAINDARLPKPANPMIDDSEAELMG